MTTMIGGSASQQLRHREEQDKREMERLEKNRVAQETEKLIIAHTEKATNTKAIYVDGELKYIPIADAKKLGLL